MAASPNLKVFNPSGEYIASCKHAEDAASLAALYGAGAKVKLGHGSVVLWHEGHEDQPAGESYDHAAGLMHARAEAHYKSFRARVRRA